MAEKIRSHWPLDVYQLSVQAGMGIFEETKSFPKEETYSLIDQVRRSSRSVSANLAEAWRKRRYRAVFINKLNDSESEAAETQVWLEYSVKCKYLDREIGKELHDEYDKIIGKLVTMINQPNKRLIG